MWASFLIFGALVRFSWQDQYVLGYLTGSQRKPGDVVYPRPGVSISGAISYAVEEVNRDSAAKGLSRRISFVVAETFGEEDVSIEQTAKLWKNNVSGYIGPQETCIHEGRMAASFNLPMISYFCIDQETSDKRYFRTFARTRPPDTQISKSLASLLLSFDWRKVIFLFPDSKDDVLRKVASTIVKSLETAEITILQTKSWHVFYQFHPLSANPFHRLVQETCQEGRIYVILGSHDEHLGLLVAMEERRLLSGGEYFVVGVELEQYDERDPEKYLRGVLTSSPDPVILRALTGYLRVAPSPSANMKNFSVNVNEYMKKPPFNFPGSTMKKVIPAEAAYLYDAVHLYAKALNRVLQNNGNPLNGTAMIEAIKGTHYKSAMGYMVYMDDNGDAEGNYTLLARKRRGNISENFGLYPVGLFIRHDNSSWLPTLVLSDKIEWVRDSPPVSEPTCGFRGEKCITHTSQIAGTIAGTILLICLVASLVFYRNWKYEQELDSLLWKIDFKDIETNENDMANSLGTKITRATHPLIRTSQVSLSSNPDADFRYSAIYTSICIYKGRVFAMQKVKKKSIDMTREMKKELKIMRDLRHENLNPFIGACTEAPNICIISEYCTRGSLRDILENEDVKLDNMFVASLVGDIVRGMIYLHDSPIKYHGKLKTSNCLVDSRWVLKLTDFGLREFKKGAESALDEASNKTPKLEGLLYKSPELLRLERNISDENGVEEEFGTQKGDVYSFAIILHELHSRRGPFGDSGLSHSIILDKVINYDPLKPPFRPHLDALENNFDFVRECLKECWAENPEERPDFKSVRTKLRPMRKGMKPNIFDNMMAMMEKYANNLEALVDDRTDQLVEEKKKTEALLYEMLPRYVAEQLKRGNKVEAENFDCVTIYFSDIVGFTAMSAESTPLQVVDFLNDLYTCFDSTIENYDVYKVETIGDAYMVVSGLPIRNGDQHAGEIATMSLHLLEAVKKFRIKHRPGEIVKLRIGIHSGPVCAGVVGLKMPRYCLFGDTVNTASRMESTGNPGHIHCSSETKILLERLGGYHLAKRGVVLMKGKGDQLTYWLKGENEEDRVKRSKEREERRALTGGNKSKHKHSQAHTRQNQQPRSSLKSKHHAGCSVRRNPLSRCSSLESPKKLRFASIDHRISKDPLLEVISDSSPKKSSHLDVGSTDHVRRTSSSCPCIEKFETNTSTNLGVLQFLNSNYYNNNNYTCSSVPLLNADVSVKTSVTAPSSPGGFDCANNINIYLDPDEVSISAPLLDKQLFND